MVLPAIFVRGHPSDVTVNVRPFPASAFPGARLAPRLDYLLFGLPLAVLAVIALLPGLVAPSLDAAVFSLVGERIAAGDLPYAQVFDHKPPGLYLLIALGDLAGGSIGAWRVSWILSVAAVALTGILIADTLRSLGWGRSAWLIGGLSVAVLASFPLALGGGMSETVAAFPAAAALRLVAIGPMGSARRFGAGAMAGMAAAISLQAAPLFAAVLVVSATRRSPAGREHDPWILRLAWIIVGAIFVSAAFVALLGSVGATAAAIRAVVIYNGAFASLAAFDDPLAGEALHALLVLSPLVVLAAAGIPSSLRAGLRRPISLGALTWLAGSTFLIVLQGRFELHYATLLVPPMAVLAPSGLALLHSHGTPQRLVRSGAIIGLLVTAVGLSGLLSTTETAMALEARGAQAARTQAVGAWINQHTSPDAEVFVWGNVPEIYLHTSRAPASAYVYLLPLTTPGYATEQMVQTVLDNWVASPPAVVVDAGSSQPGAAGLPELLLDRPTARLDGRNLDLLGPLREFVRERYTLSTTIQGWPVYTLN